MKKLILTIITIISLGFCANAQMDGFFGGCSDACGDRATGMNMPTAIEMPTSEIGSHANETVPLGSGLIILGVLGVGYAAANRKK